MVRSVCFGANIRGMMSILGLNIPQTTPASRPAGPADLLLLLWLTALSSVVSIDSSTDSLSFADVATSVPGQRCFLFLLFCSAELAVLFIFLVFSEAASSE